MIKLKMMSPDSRYSVTASLPGRHYGSHRHTHNFRNWYIRRIHRCEYTTDKDTGAYIVSFRQQYILRYFKFNQSKQQRVQYSWCRFMKFCGLKIHEFQTRIVGAIMIKKPKVSSNCWYRLQLYSTANTDVLRQTIMNIIGSLLGRENASLLIEKN